MSTSENSRRSNSECSCNKPRRYWLEVDAKNGNPISETSVCWAYYPDDRPVEGNWILVEERKGAW
jgi:hypothetical protein